MQDNAVSTINRFKLPIALCLLGVILIIGGIFASGANKQRLKTYPKDSLVESQIISVDVSGAVNKPGVYQLKPGSRIEEAIAAAAGFAENAHQEYISKYLNLAQKLVDGSKIYVPAEGDPTSFGGYAGQSGAVAGVQSKININLASQAELEALPGIGPVTAVKIISNRPYTGVEELLNKKVVSKAVFEKIKGQIVIY